MTAVALSPRQQALDLLMSRQSRWPLTVPAPSDAELGLVIDAALRAPDHGQLQPWRFVLVRGDARQALGEVFVQAARERDPEGYAGRFRAKAMAAMNVLNALHLLGYGGFWATGLNSYDANVRQALGFADTDRLAGFLYVGTPKDAAGPAQRPARDRFVREWVPAAATV